MSKLRDKTSFKLSESTQWREREPTAPEVADRGNPKMTIDYSRQNAVVPERLGQTTRYGENDSKFRTMNAGGAPKALDTMVGGGPDARSRGFGVGGADSPVKGR
jgi:hypothetical protein